MKLSLVVLNRNTENNKSVVAELMKPGFLWIWILHPPHFPTSLAVSCWNIYVSSCLLLSPCKTSQIYPCSSPWKSIILWLGQSYVWSDWLCGICLPNGKPVYANCPFSASSVVSIFLSKLPFCLFNGKKKKGIKKKNILLLWDLCIAQIW